MGFYMKDTTHNSFVSATSTTHVSVCTSAAFTLCPKKRQMRANVPMCFVPDCINVQQREKLCFRHARLAGIDVTDLTIVKQCYCGNHSGDHDGKCSVPHCPNLQRRRFMCHRHAKELAAPQRGIYTPAATPSKAKNARLEPPTPVEDNYTPSNDFMQWLHRHMVSMEAEKDFMDWAALEAHSQRYVVACVDRTRLE
ncbi:Aste57867_5701 [Aphanomyces stellatus]|uniref:Aste57867_5680 protein n=1 Tax=Aphanomyces stellatus TaxID=120398 RepID=A0A485KEJ2_9STRA|nr:hypothetical protein As57867_005688 [Aphanomyces stellatus]KAF0709988.1 hypothetical protein As57867_005667 [Aphanomyces stellatus]VFT82720.1 Aste57867_5680 [Aphanomyces stellatus]VFT82741.1 Aste57867_5701 [Aphanomyces stellatus]